MKKMLLAGCSHSVGFGLENIEDSWGNIFAKNNNYTLTNVAKAASSLQYSIQKIIENIHKEHFDTIILQLTTFDRYPISYDGENRFLTNDILNKNQNVNDVFHLVPINYLDAVSNKKLPLNPEYIKFFYENVMYSTFYINTIINEIYLLQELLKYKGIDFILIPYDDYFWGNYSYMNIWRLDESKKIDKTRYIDYPFMKWLKDNYTPDDYYIDNGFHLNINGHRLFAEEYLPSFIKIK
jgi:hypothetical protein